MACNIVAVFHKLLWVLLLSTVLCSSNCKTAKDFFCIRVVILIKLSLLLNFNFILFFYGFQRTSITLQLGKFAVSSQIVVD